MKFDYYTVQVLEDGTVAAYGWSTWPEHSVLAGQPKKVYLETFDSPEAAKSAYPSANFSGPLTEPQTSLNHLSDGPDL